MIALYTMLLHWKQRIIVWRKQCHVLGIIFGIALWAVLAVGWPVLLVIWLVVYR